MVVAELLAGARDKREQNVIDSFLAPFTILSPTEADALLALDLFRQHRLADGVDWPDCLIAATALRLGTDVFTQNTKHFGAFAGLRAQRAY
jgi:predicted nucleic acid-binding protein